MKTEDSQSVVHETIAMQLAASICAAASAKLDDDVVHAVERVVLDSMGCAIGAVAADAPTSVRAWAQMIGGTPAASIIGTREKSSVFGAALANCTMIRQLDLNDCSWGSSDSGHPSDNVGACLSVAEVSEASGIDLIRAVLVAFEVQMRTTEIAKVSFFRKTGWDVTMFVSLASAAATGTLLRLDAGRMAHAFAIAASYAPTGQMRVGQISMMKSTSAGLAASRGVEAAYLAAKGITGPLEVFEGKRGLGKLVLGECDWDVLTAPIKEWRLPRTCLKRYPAAYIIHSAIDAALALRRDHALAPERIKQATVHGFSWLIEDMVHGMGGRSRYDIDVRETADHSLPYCVAVALVDGEYTLAQLENPRWRDADVKAMLAKLKCEHDPSLDSQFPAIRPSRVTIETVDGAVYSKFVPYPKGDPRDPLSDEEVAAKFNRLSAKVLTPERQRVAVDTSLNLRKHSVRELVNAVIA